MDNLLTNFTFGIDIINDSYDYAVNILMNVDYENTLVSNITYLAAN